MPVPNKGQNSKLKIFKTAARVKVAVREIAGERAGFIYCTFPLYVSKTSPEVVELLRLCDGTRTLTDLSKLLKKSPASLLKVLQSLEAKQLVEELAASGLQMSGLQIPPTDTNEVVWSSVSVIVPVYNRPQALESCLNALMQLDYPADKLEIIVIDDASTDNTAEVAARFPVRLLINIRNLGPAGSRNAGLQIAKGDLIAFVDSDCLVTRDWLKQLAGLFGDASLAAAGGLTLSQATSAGLGVRGWGLGKVQSQEAVEVVGGRSVVRWGKSKILGYYEEAKSALAMGERPLEIKLDSAYNYLPTCNLVVRRSDLQAQGGFDAAMRFGEDVDLCWRLMKQGRRIRYQPAAVLNHAFRATLSGFLKTRFDYATSEAALVARHPDKRRTFFLQAMPVVVWLAGLLALGWRRPWPLAALIWPLWAAFAKWRGIRKWQLPISLGNVVVSELRSCGVAGYHIGVHLGRYYSLPLTALLLPKRTRLPVLFVLLAPVIVDYSRQKTALNLPTFAVLQLLENGAYQIGLIAGCRREGAITALLPRLKIQF